jgi:PAS domain S-box-containing protein
MARTHPAEILRLRKTVRAACQHDDVDRAFATILRLLSEAHGWAVAEAWVVRSDGSALEMAPVCYCRDDGFRPFVDVALGFVVDRGIGLPGSAWASRQPVVTHDVLEEPRFARAAFVRDFGLRGALTVPVPAAEPAVILSFFDTQPRELDVELVESLADLGPDIASLVRRRRQGLDLERRLRITEQRHRALFERSPAAIFVAGRDGTITDANVALAKIVGGAVPAEVVGRRFPEFLADPGEWDRLAARLGLERSVSDLELRLRRTDGAVRWILANVTKVDDEREAWRVEGQLLDLTERKRNEDAQRETLRTVAALARATAHEILNPLNPLLGQLALLAREIDDPEKNDKIGVAIRNAEAIRDIVRRMIKITQLEFERRPDDVAALLDIRSSAPEPPSP